MQRSPRDNKYPRPVTDFQVQNRILGEGMMHTIEEITALALFQIKPCELMHV